MKKTSSKLYSKRFDIKLSKIIGGVATQQDSSEITEEDNCSDQEHTVTDDNGTVISTCTEYDCNINMQ